MLNVGRRPSPAKSSDSPRRSVLPCPSESERSSRVPRGFKRRDGVQCCAISRMAYAKYRCRAEYEHRIHESLSSAAVQHSMLGTKVVPSDNSRSKVGHMIEQYLNRAIHIPLKDSWESQQERRPSASQNKTASEWLCKHTLMLYSTTELCIQYTNGDL